MGRQDTITIHRDEYKTLIRLIVDERLKAGLGQREVARRIKLPQATLWTIEKGERRLDALEFLNLSVAIGFNPGELLEEVKRLHPEVYNSEDV
ncbi:MAG: helix-turn-helix transcriptional regulator [Fimbriimonadaceae bacterium]|nr:helix-turn-helix transcriptional regulator [Fimbriimonadaceae bacterium]